jgi:hypothetical protein
MKFVTLSALALLSLALAACGPSVEMPKGTSKGYTSARLTQRDSEAPPITDAKEQLAHRLIQQSLAKQFAAKGLAYGKRDADLVVAYLVLYQEPGVTSSYPAYFGYGRNAYDITDLAHVRGSVNGKRPDFFRQAGIVVDVIDSRTNKLVYRGFAKGDVIKGASESTRAARIDAGVAQALAGFFR